MICGPAKKNCAKLLVQPFFVYKVDGDGICKSMECGIRNAGSFGDLFMRMQLGTDDIESPRCNHRLGHYCREATVRAQGKARTIRTEVAKLAAGRL